MTRPNPQATSPTQANVSRIVNILLPFVEASQADLADALGVSPSVITKALNGSRKWTPDDIAIMAEFFDCSVSVFFEEPAALIRNRWSSDGVIDLRDRRSPSRVTPAPYAEAIPASHIQAMDAA